MPLTDQRLVHNNSGKLFWLYLRTLRNDVRADGNQQGVHYRLPGFLVQAAHFRTNADVLCQVVVGQLSQLVREIRLQIDHLSEFLPR